MFINMLIKHLVKQAFLLTNEYSILAFTASRVDSMATAASVKQPVANASNSSG